MSSCVQTIIRRSVSPETKKGGPLRVIKSGLDANNKNGWNKDVHGVELDKEATGTQELLIKVLWFWLLKEKILSNFIDSWRGFCRFRTS